MSRPRPQPGTPFGHWLDGWLRAHDAWTFDAFAHEVGVTKSAVSLWVRGPTKKIAIDKLRRVSEVTGEPIENLERLVYGEASTQGVTAKGYYFTEEALTALLHRAADEAAERALAKYRDQQGGHDA